MGSEVARQVKKELGDIDVLVNNGMCELLTRSFTSWNCERKVSVQQQRGFDSANYGCEHDFSFLDDPGIRAGHAGEVDPYRCCC